MIRKSRNRLFRKDHTPTQKRVMPKSMRVVLAGFGPFPGAPFNPSAKLVEALARRRRPALAETTLLTHVFATTYAAVDGNLPGLWAKRPDVILMFGLAGRRRHLCIETRARNAVSVIFPDADGRLPRRGEIVRGGPEAKRGAAPFVALLHAARAGNFPARLSRDAGRYLCNYAYWQALDRAGRPGGSGPLVQFVHIPPVRLQPRPPRARTKLPSFQSLVAAAEAVLIALIAASRR
jgi:pyroglutamyl-peptidase